MTEQEWLTAINPTRMLEYLRGKTSDRKLRLFAVACCRHLWHLMTEERCRNAVEVAERLADGLATNVERRTAALAGYDPSMGEHPACFGAAGCAVGVPAFHAAERSSENAAGLAANKVPYLLHGNIVNPAWQEAIRREGVVQISLIAEIFGNPFRSVAFDPAWRTSDALLLARGIYEERAFDGMPILADALQDAGCDSDDILGHLRDASATHVRGCWALDLVLGKE